MNPKGKWFFRNLEMQYVNEDILALYGKAYPWNDGDRGQRWYWEARVVLDARLKVDSPAPCGYAKTKEQAMEIVETILRCTETCEF
jgi:hypothetical protein